MAHEPDGAREIEALYREILAGWNAHDAEAFARPFAQDAVVIGFDGSQHRGRDGIARDIGRIFADHETGRFVGKVRDVRLLDSNTALLMAVSAIVPPGRDDIEPMTNAVQSLLARRTDGAWRVVLYQNTPAQYHGRPELSEALTAELREEWRQVKDKS